MTLIMNTDLYFVCHKAWVNGSITNSLDIALIHSSFY